MIFHHTPDGLIVVDGFSYPLNNFLLDEPAYALPAGMTGRLYIQGQVHFLYDALSATTRCVDRNPRPLPWLEGDAYLAKRAIYEAANAARWYVGAGQPYAGTRIGSDQPVAPRPTTYSVYTGTVSMDAAVAWRAPDAAEMDAIKSGEADRIAASPASVTEYQKAFTLVVLDEINAIRVRENLSRLFGGHG